MVGHLRIYTINSGMMDSWIRLFEEELVPKVKEAGMGIQAAWVNQERTQFIWIRTYDNIEDIKVKEAAFYGSEFWKANVGRIRGHLAHRDIVVIEPLSC